MVDTPKRTVQDVTNTMVERNGAQQAANENKKQTNVLSTQKQILVDQSTIMGTTNNLLNSLVDKFSTFIQFMVDQADKDRIAANLAAANKAKMTEGDGSGSAGITKDNATGLPTMFVAAFLAYISGVDKFIRAVQLPKTIKAITKAFSAVGDLFSKSFPKTIQATKDLITKPFIKIQKALTAALKVVFPVNPLDTLKGIGAKIAKPFINFFDNIKAGFAAVGKPIKVVQDAAGKFTKQNKVFQFLGRGFKLIGDFFGKVFGFFKGIFAPVTKFLGAIGRIVGSKLLFPLFALFDFVKGFFDGFRKTADETRSFGQRILDGIGTGILEIIRGFLFIPLDLIKDLISWAAGKLGFDGFSDVLDSFSFVELFNMMVQKIGDIIRGIGDWFGTLFSDPVAAIVSLAKTTLKIITAPGRLFFDKVLKPIIDWFGSLFGLGDGSSSYVSGGETLTQLIGNKLDGLLNFGKTVYNKYIKPVIDWFKNLFGFGGEEGVQQAEGQFMDLFGGIDLSSILDSIPTVDSILSKVGEKINNAFQAIAGAADNIPVVGNKLAKFFSSSGVNIADFFGAQNISKFNPQTGERDVLMANGGVTEAGMAVGLGSQEVAQGQATATSNYVSAPNVNAGNYSTNVSNNTKINMGTAKPDKRMTRQELEAEGIYL